MDVRLRGDFGSEDSICCSSIWLGDGFAWGLETWRGSWLDRWDSNAKADIEVAANSECKREM